MKLTGETVLDAPLDRVYATMYEPASLARAIPGCDELVEVAPATYRMSISVGILALRGTFGGDIWLEDREAPRAFTVKASSSGPLGSVVAAVDVLLAEAPGGRTRLTYDGEMHVQGPITAVGGFIMSRTAKQAASAFFSTINKVIAVSPAPIAA